MVSLGWAIKGSFRLVREGWARCGARASGRPLHGYIGWAGHGNSGDDSMFTAARRLCPDVQWTQVLPGKRTLSLMAALGLNEPGYLASAALGGGTLIGHDMYLHAVKTLQKKGLSLWAFGTGVGSCGWSAEPNAELREWAEPLTQFKGIGVRGPLSRDSLEALGVPRVRIVGDLALSLALEAPVQAPPTPCIGLNLSVPQTQAGSDGINGMVRALTEVARRRLRQGCRILPFAMARSDIPPLKRLVAALGLDRCRVFYSTKADAVIDHLSRCTTVIGVRLHSAVFACCAGVSPVMLGYRTKCLDFMSSMGLEPRHVPFLHMTENAIYNRIESLSAPESVTYSDRCEVLRRAHQWKAAQIGFLQEMVGPKARGDTECMR